MCLSNMWASNCHLLLFHPQIKRWYNCNMIRYYLLGEVFNFFVVILKYHNLISNGEELSAVWHRNNCTLYRLPYAQTTWNVLTNTQVCSIQNRTKQNKTKLKKGATHNKRSRCSSLANTKAFSPVRSFGRSYLHSFSYMQSKAHTWNKNIIARHGTATHTHSSTHSIVSHMWCTVVCSGASNSIGLPL